MLLHKLFHEHIIWQSFKSTTFPVDIDFVLSDIPKITSAVI